MDLSSRWDRYATLFVLLLAVAAMSGCQGLFGGSSSTQTGSFSAAATSLDFGTAVVGSSTQLTDSLTNRSSAPVTIASAVSSDPDFRVAQPAMPVTLSPGQSVSLSIAFAPQTAGKPAGKIAIKSDVPSAAEIDVAVSGSAVAAGTLTVSPVSLAFGNVQVGQSQVKAAKLTNPGGTSVTISQDSVSSAAFMVSGLTLPITLSAGQSAMLNVTFSPTSTGAASGSVKVSGNSSLTMNSSSGSQATEPTSTVLSLSGAGTTDGQLAVTPASVSFGNVTVGSTQSQTVTVTNSGGASATISQTAVTGSGLSVSGHTLPLTLTPGQSSPFQVTFAPASAGAVAGSFTIVSTAVDPSLTTAVTGTGVPAGALSISPTSIAFGSVLVGSSQSQTETLKNSGGSAVHISNDSITGAGFAVSGITVPTTLNAGQTLTFQMIFAPQSSGAVTGGLTITADGSVPSLSVPLSGTGGTPGQLSVTPATLTFGNVTVGATQSQGGTLTANGAAVTVSTAVSSNQEFVLTGLSLPLNLSAGQSAPFTLAFKPQASGAASATVTFASNATNSPGTESVTGTGVAAVQHNVGLSWTASTSTVVGYNVYRGSQSGGPYVALTGAADASTTYTDSSVQAGQTYYYVVTAIDGSGNESVYSNQAQAVVPTP